MFLTLLKFFQGYLIIKVHGKEPERFINLCVNNNIYIWDLTKQGKDFIFSIKIKSFFKLSPIAKKTKCRVKILKKSGLPFRLKKFRERTFFIYGLLICFLLIIFFSFFIWRIEIEGNKLYTYDEIYKFLYEEDIVIGKFKPSINCKNIDNKILTHFKNANWVSSEVKGTRLIIHIREGVPLLIKENNKDPSDIIASNSGTIISIITRKGTPLVKEGDEVEKEDVLVSGTLVIKELEEIKGIRFTHSDADIYIRTKYYYSDKVKFKYKDKVYLEDKGEKDKSFIILNKKINIIKPKIYEKNYDIIEKQIQVKLFENFYLPIYINDIEYLPFIIQDKVYSIDEAKRVLEKSLILYQENLEKSNIKVISLDINYYKEGEYLILSGDIYVVEKTGILKDFNPKEREIELNDHIN